MRQNSPPLDANLGPPPALTPTVFNLNLKPSVFSVRSVLRVFFPISSWGETFTIDAWGNLTNIGPMGKTNYQNFNCAPATTSNQITSCYGANVYDAAGNMFFNGQYVFDYENRIVSAGGYSYMYDGDGNRIKKCAAGSCVGIGAGTIYWGSGPLAETTPAGVKTSEYVFFNGTRVARRDFSGDSSTVKYYFSDHLGSTSVVTNNQGGDPQRTEYYPYGGEIPGANNTDPNHYKFTGKERDSETGLDYFGARYYGSNMGRWMSPDWSAAPIAVPYADLTDPQTLNLYGYVRNNPLSKADLDGHSDYTWQKINNWLHRRGYRTNAQVQGLTVAQTARNHRDSMDWAINTTNISGRDVGHTQVFKSPSNKCNQFVGDTLAEAGKKRPEITDKDGNTRMPTAHELADPSVKIPGLSAPQPLSDAKPGDVIAQQHGDFGHSGIVVAPGQTASVNTAGANGGKITINDWGFRPVPFGPLPASGGPNGESWGDPAPVVRHPED